MLKRKENFKIYGMSTRPAKNQQVLYSIVIILCLELQKIVFKIYYKLELLSKNFIIVAKCGVDNQPLKILKRKENFKRSILIKNMIYKKKTVSASQL